MQFASNGLSIEKPISTVADPDHELRFFVTCPAGFSTFHDSFQHGHKMEWKVIFLFNQTQRE